MRTTRLTELPAGNRCWRHLFTAAALATLCGAAVPSSVSGESGEDVHPEWIVYDSHNAGIPEGAIISIDFDSKGNTWLGMDHVGVVKFDGVRSTLYSLETLGFADSPIACVAVDAQDRVWVGSGFPSESYPSEGMAVYNGTSWTRYDTLNSGLISNTVTDILFDRDGIAWIGTFRPERTVGGLVRFDGSHWQTIDLLSAGLPTNDPTLLAFDSHGDLWVAARRGGLGRYDGTSWHDVYNPGNSWMSFRTFITALAVDRQDRKWLGIWDFGIAMLDEEGWHTFTMDNSPLPQNRPTVIEAAPDGTIWIGTSWPYSPGGGVVKYDGVSWNLFTTNNSGLPGANVGALKLDEYGNLWIGTENAGLAVYRGGGVILQPPTAIEEKRDRSTPCAFSLAQNFPNPFNQETSIRFALPREEYVELSVFDLAGQKVATLVRGRLSRGMHQVGWDGRAQGGTDAGSGVYIYRLRSGQRVKTRKLVLLQ